MIVEGTVHRNINGIGVRIPFFINGDDGTCSQWGQSTEILGENVDLLEKLRDAVWQETNDALGEDDCSLGLVPPPRVGDGYCQDEPERDR